MSTIMFVFGGRKANLEIQMPFLTRILEEHDDVELHIWNLAQNPEDAKYLHTLSGDRVEVFDDFYKVPLWQAFNLVYAYYAAQKYREATFVKIDDDVTFIETGGFGPFLEAVEASHTGGVVSAKVVNNGACLSTEPGMQAAYDKLHARTGLVLLDVHESAEFAQICHRYFFDHWQEMTNQTPGLIPTNDWLSINFIGYTWETGVRISRLVGTRSPRYVAGRRYGRADYIGDEGVVNTLTRHIFQGLTVGHLTFGPQEKELKKAELAELRKGYAELASKYLDPQ